MMALTTQNQIEPCAHRWDIGLDKLFYCRHPRVHVTGNLVSSAVCRDCTRSGDEVAAPRPVPSQSCAGLADEPGRFYRSADLAAETARLIAHVASNVSAVAGIPRSGMIAASLAAALLHVPLFEVHQKQGLRRLDHGSRLEDATVRRGSLLVLDDSVHSGAAMEAARRIVSSSRFHKRSVFAAIFVRPERLGCVDLFARLAPQPHYFEWNLLNCSQARRIALDMDGVICDDWPGGDEEGELYQTFLENSPPRWLPRRHEVPLIVTARLEKHRSATLAWLRRHGVRVRSLVMGPWQNASKRRRHYDAGIHKGLAYRTSDCQLFIESDERQAERIYETARRPVLCATTGKVLR